MKHRFSTVEKPTRPRSQSRSPRKKSIYRIDYMTIGNPCALRFDRQNIDGEVGSCGFVSELLATENVSSTQKSPEIRRSRTVCSRISTLSRHLSTHKLTKQLKHYSHSQSMNNSFQVRPLRGLQNRDAVEVTGLDLRSVTDDGLRFLEHQICKFELVVVRDPWRGRIPFAVATWKSTLESNFQYHDNLEIKVATSVSARSPNDKKMMRSPTSSQGQIGKSVFSFFETGKGLSRGDVLLIRNQLHG